MKGIICRVGIGFLTVLFAASVHANLITITGTTATVECTAGAVDPACEGFTGGGAPGFPTGPGTLSATIADVYDLPNSSLATETEALNILAGTTFTAADAVKFDVDAGASFDFSTDGLYFLIKTGFGSTFYRNNGGLTTLLVEYDQNDAQAGGFSHFTVWGDTPSQVPEPGSLALLGAGLLGLSFMRRRRA